MPHKRQNYLEWEEYFMSIAFLSAQRSKDPRTQVGACIVNSQNKIVGIGYNGMPIGCPDDDMPWNRQGSDETSTDSWLNSKSPYVCHAELNAVLNKNLADISDCKIYVALFPCNMCSQIIVQSGIKEVIFYSDKYHDRPQMIASRRLLDMAGVKYRQFKPSQKKVVIDFEVIESTPGLDGSVVSKVNGESVLSSSDRDGSNGKGEITVNNNNRRVEKSSSFDNHAEVEALPHNLLLAQQRIAQHPSFTRYGVYGWNSNFMTSVVFVVVAFFFTWLGTLLPFLGIKL